MRSGALHLYAGILRASGNRGQLLRRKKGIVVDLNMGSGWNANSQDVTYEESMGNMALGRTTLTGAEAKSAVEIPAAERSSFIPERTQKENGERTQ